MESFTSAASKLDLDPALLSPSPSEKGPTHVATCLLSSPVCLSSCNPMQIGHRYQVFPLLQSLTLEAWQI